MQPQCLGGILSGQIRPAELRGDFRCVAEIASLFDLEAELAIDMVGLGIEIVAALQVAGLAMEPGDQLEVAGFLLPEPTLTGQREGTVEERERESWLAQGIMRRTQLSQDVLFSSDIAASRWEPDRPAE